MYFISVDKKLKGEMHVMKKTRVIALLVAVLMIVTLFAGCGNGGDNEGPKNTSGSQTAEKNFNGYAFTIAGSKNKTWIDTPTNVVEAKQMQEYYNLESKYNCTIEWVDIDQSQILTYGMTGDNMGDLVHTRHQYWGEAALAGVLRPLNTEDMVKAGLDVSNPDQVDLVYTNMAKELDGVNVYGTCFSGEYYVQAFGHAIAFNKRLVEGAGYKSADLYQAVREFKWDWTMFEEIARAVSQDADQDGVPEVAGYAPMPNEYLELFSNGVGLVYRDTETGKWKSSCSLPQFVTAAEWYVRIWNDSDISLYDPARENGNGDRRKIFYSGKMGFMGLWGGNFGYGDGDANMACVDDYGYVPIFHGPDATTYAHYIPDLHCYSIQTANQDWEKAAFLLGQMGWAFNDPDAKSATLRTLFRDDESVEMILNYMLPNAHAQPARWTTALRESNQQFQMTFVSGEAPSAVCEAMDQAQQAAIDDSFHYSK